MRLLRILLQLVLFCVVLAAVIGVGSGDTGWAERLVLVAVGLIAIGVAAPVRRIGRAGTAHG